MNFVSPCTGETVIRGTYIMNDTKMNIDSEGNAVEFEETLEQTDKKCPMCGGTLDFDPSSGALLCPYCGNIVEIKTEDDHARVAEELDFNAATLTENCDWGTEKRVVICKNCGAETVYAASAVAGECPYCGSNQVLEAGDENTMAPNGVCPFTVSEQSARAGFIRWIKGKLFCPSAAKKSAKAGKMKGVYLPYWTFDADTHSAYTARYGKVRTVRRGKETKTVVDWYNTAGTYDEFINDELICATEKHEQKLIDGVAPFDTDNSVEYKPEYIAGFASERYSLGLKAAWEKAKNFIKKKLASRIESHIKRRHAADRVDRLNINTVYSNIKYKYLMLPIWISSFTYNGKVYKFFVNGRTGKVSGRSPISPLRVSIAVLIGLAVVIGLAYLFYAKG